MVLKASTLKAEKPTYMIPCCTRDVLGTKISESLRTIQYHRYKQISISRQTAKSSFTEAMMNSDKIITIWVAEKDVDLNLYRTGTGNSWASESWVYDWNHTPLNKLDRLDRKTFPANSNGKSPKFMTLNQWPPCLHSQTFLDAALSALR